MRRITTRARWTAGLSALAAALVALGTANAQAAPQPAAAARVAGPATTTSTTSTTAAPGATQEPAAAPAELRPPTAARHAAAIAGAPDGQTVVTVRFRKGVKAAAAAPRALSYRATTRSVAALSNAATYTVPAADAAAFIRTMKARADVADAAPTLFAHYDAVPNDPQYATAVASGAARQVDYMPAIGAPTAWDYGRGSATVKVAVIDSGVDVGHPDLAAKIVAKYNAVTGSTTNVTDTVGHGTFVAGVAAAVTNNATGVAGAGWDTGIVAVKVAAANGSIDLDAVVDGINWSVANGADVINLSLGTESNYPPLRTAVANAVAAGVLVVSSAGNSAQDGNLKSYPAAYPGVISVGATDAHGLRAWFSQYGSWVTMAAPGVDIRSTVPRVATTFWPNDTSYANGDGTSFSSPLVAGALALVWARSPNATAAQVKAAVVNTAHGYTGFGLGKGQLDMGRAMKAIVPTTNPTVASPADSDVITDSVTFSADAGMFNASIGTKIGWYVDGTRVGFSASNAPFGWDPRGWSQGAHTVQARICTTAGVCAATGTSRSVSVNMAAPTITSPAEGDAVPGFAQVAVTTTTEGGGIAIYEGTTRVGFAVNVGGTTFLPEVNFTGRNGAHALRAVVCNSAGTRCAGAESTVVNVTSTSLGLTKGAVTNTLISPNGDGFKDKTSVTYTLATDQVVRVQVWSGGTSIRTLAVGTPKPAGTYTITWDGKDGAGLAFSNDVVLRISTTESPAGRTALLTVPLRVDMTKPTLAVPIDNATTFYPVVDGYKDSFRPRYTVDETSTVSLVIKNAAGTTVRTVTGTVKAGATPTVTWNGKNSAGSLVPAGTYSWRVIAKDAAGLSASTHGRSIAVKRTKLVSRTVTLTKNGDQAHARNQQSCATAVFTGSTYPRGFWLKNNCAKGSVNIAAGYYYFTVPSAVKYTGFTIRTTGRSHSAPVDVYGGLYTSQTKDYDITSPRVTVPTGATTTRTLTLGTIRSGGRPTPVNRVVDVLVFVSNANRSPFTDWDVKTVSVTVSYQALA